MTGRRGDMMESIEIYGECYSRCYGVMGHVGMGILWGLCGLIGDFIGDVIEMMWGHGGP